MTERDTPPPSPEQSVAVNAFNIAINSIRVLNAEKRFQPEAIQFSDPAQLDARREEQRIEQQFRYQVYTDLLARTGVVLHQPIEEPPFEPLHMELGAGKLFGSFLKIAAGPRVDTEVQSALSYVVDESISALVRRHQEGVTDYELIKQLFAAQDGMNEAGLYGSRGMQFVRRLDEAMTNDVVQEQLTGEHLGLFETPSAQEIGPQTWHTLPPLELALHWDDVIAFLESLRGSSRTWALLPDTLRIAIHQLQQSEASWAQLPHSNPLSDKDQLREHVFKTRKAQLRRIQAQLKPTV